MEKGDGSINPFSFLGPSSDMDMDLSTTSSNPSKPTRFPLKPRFKPSFSKKDQEPPPAPLVKKEEEKKEQETPPSPPPLPPELVKKEDEKKEVLMDVEDQISTTPVDEQCLPSHEEEEDRVVREIDVFLSPSPLDSNAKLYVMQYPLRPCWRPYEFNERCQEVRVKPKQSKIEVDLTVDVNSENYDNDAAEYLKLQKQTLSSSKTPLVTGYAVGVLTKNKLHLNPVHAVVQLRPSMAYLKNKKNVGRSIPEATNLDKGNTEESAKASRLQGNLAAESSNVQHTNPASYAHMKQAEDSEPWVALEHHGVDSSFSDIYRQKMVAENGGQIQFHMSSSDYINSLVPGRPNTLLAGGLSRRVLDSLPLEERFNLLFSEGPSQVLRFEVLLRIAPDGSTEQEILKVLQQHAHLVQGLWVSKSPLRFEGFPSLLRDYILLLFSKNRIIHHEKLKAIKASKEVLRSILDPLAVVRSGSEGWEFKQPMDKSFIKTYPDVVREQDQFWSTHEKQITDAAHGLGKNTGSLTRNPLRPGMNSVLSKTLSIHSEQGVRKGPEGLQALEKTITMSEETREALLKALRELFDKHHVCSFNLILQGLRGMAVSKSSQPKAHSKPAIAAALGASAPQPELLSVINQVATEIRGVYVLKSLNNPSVDPYRNVVLDLLRAKPSTEKLKKNEITEACKIALKMEFPKAVYTQVLNQLCVWKGNAWVLKNGDGVPP